jgi:hypothetical protein
MHDSIQNYQSKTILALSLPLATLIITTACVGLFTPDFYSGETPNWIAQSIGQDAIDLFLITPFLIITSILAAAKNRIAFLLWGGVNLYLIYTFVIYCFDVHFNRLFLIYCAILGLSFYSFLYFLFSQPGTPIKDENYKNSAVKITAIYFLIIPCVFYFLWLAEIVPAIISHTTPRSLIETGLATNPVHVMDLSVFLPGIFIIAVLLLKERPLGLLLAPVILVFFVLMDITIGGLVIAMKIKGIETGYTITLIMSVLAVFSLVLLIWYLISINTSQNFKISDDITTKTV